MGTRIRSITSRPAKSIIPPDVVDGGPPDKPILVRTSTLRYAATYKQLMRPKKSRGVGYQWNTLEITIPREIIEAAGWEQGMTICVEAYVDGRLRLFPAGDVLSRVEEEI